MRKVFSILLLICVGSSLLSAVEKKTAAVAPFEIRGNAASKDEAETITELYIRTLETMGNVVVSDIGKFSNLLKELKFQESDWSDARKTRRLGDAINAKVICRNKISKLGSMLYISSTFIEAKTARVLYDPKVPIEDLDKIQLAFAYMLVDVLEKIAPIKIGDKGPGGGIVFSVDAKNDRAFECSEDLGYGTFKKAEELTKQYRGGGYDDWSLPNGDLLTKIYGNLVEPNKGISFYITYWTKLDQLPGKVWVRKFLSGSNDENYFLSPKSAEHGIVAVRHFRLSELE